MIRRRIQNDGFCESMLRSLMENGSKCLENPEDYTARAEMMLACTYGCKVVGKERVIP